MNLETKMLIKQAEASTKEELIKELRARECESEEVQDFLDSAIDQVEKLDDKEIRTIKTQLLSIN